MAASRSDSWFLSQDTGFQHRVQSSLMNYCSVINSEGFTVPFHRERAVYVNQILQTLNTANSVVPVFAAVASVNATVLSDVTQAGTVALTASNTPAQAALATDTDIDNAVSSQFNAFVRVPQS